MDNLLAWRLALERTELRSVELVPVSAYFDQVSHQRCIVPYKTSVAEHNFEISQSVSIDVDVKQTPLTSFFLLFLHRCQDEANEAGIPSSSVGDIDGGSCPDQRSWPFEKSAGAIQHVERQVQRGPKLPRQRAELWRKMGRYWTQVDMWVNKLQVQIQCAIFLSCHISIILFLFFLSPILFALRMRIM